MRTFTYCGPLNYIDFSYIPELLGITLDAIFPLPDGFTLDNLPELKYVAAHLEGQAAGRIFQIETLHWVFGNLKGRLIRYKLHFRIPETAAQTMAGNYGDDFLNPARNVLAAALEATDYANATISPAPNGPD